MRFSTLFSIACAAVLIVALVGVTSENHRVSAADREQVAQASGAQDSAAMIARGKYLANDVAMCVVCHSAKDSAGRVIKGKELRGGAIPVDSPFTGPRWADNAPALLPLVQERAEDVFQVLTTGIWPRSGETPQGPMPPFRLSEDDARAIIAYLKSVK